MKKDVKAVFTLTDAEVREALYEFYVRKFRGLCINAVFRQNDIIIDLDDNYLDVSLTITEEQEL